MKTKIFSQIAWFLQYWMPLTKLVLPRRIITYLYVDLAVLHIFLLVAFGAHEEAQDLVPLTLPPLVLTPALFGHIDVKP